MHFTYCRISLTLSLFPAPPVCPGARTCPRPNEPHNRPDDGGWLLAGFPPCFFFSPSYRLPLPPVAVFVVASRHRSHHRPRRRRRRRGWSRSAGGDFLDPWDGGRRGVGGVCRGCSSCRGVSDFPPHPFSAVAAASEETDPSRTRTSYLGDNFCIDRGLRGKE
jgi:hypothetical protein